MDARTANIMILVAVVIFSFDDFILVMIPHDVTDFEVMVLSFAIAAPVVTVFMRKHLKGGMERKLLCKVFLMTVLYVAYNILNLGSLHYLDVDDASFIFTLSVVIVPVIDLALGIRMKSQVGLGVLAIIGGVWMTSNAAFSANLMGVSLSLAGAIARSFFLVFLNHVSNTADTRKLIVYMYWFSCIILMIVLLAVDPGFLRNTDLVMKALPAIALFSMTSLIVATSLVFVAQRHTTPLITVVLLSTQIIFTVVTAAVLPESTGFHRDLTPVMFVGLIFVFVGILAATGGLNPLVERIKERRAERRG